MSGTKSTRETAPHAIEAHITTHGNVMPLGQSVGVGIGVAVAIAVGFGGLARPIATATAIATPIPIPTPRILPFLVAGGQRNGQ